MRLSPEVDRLMWLAAESEDPAAIEDFAERFPGLRNELAKRIEMVRRMRASGREAHAGAAVPPFRAPRRMGRQTLALRWSMAALALTALAFGSFHVTRAWIARPAPEEKATAALRYEPVPDALLEGRDEPETSPSVQESSTASGAQPPDDEPHAVPAWQKRYTVKLENVGLRTALEAIAQQCGLEMVLPPDLPDDQVVVDYRSMTAQEMLADMGLRFGFTAFDQGEGKVLVVPARESPPDSAELKAPPSARRRDDEGG
jgi:hypothetical protein